MLICCSGTEYHARNGRVSIFRIGDTIDQSTFSEAELQELRERGIGGFLIEGDEGDLERIRRAHALRRNQDGDLAEMDLMLTDPEVPIAQPAELQPHQSSDPGAADPIDWSRKRRPLRRHQA